MFEIEKRTAWGEWVAIDLLDTREIARNVLNDLRANNLGVQFRIRKA